MNRWQEYKNMLPQSNELIATPVPTSVMEKIQIEMVYSSGYRLKIEDPVIPIFQDEARLCFALKILHLIS